MILLIVLGEILIISLITVYWVRPSIPQQQEYIMNFYSSVLSDMNIDLADSTIGAKNIVDIGIAIQNLSLHMENFSKQPLSIEQKKWLIDHIVEFRTQLKLWMTRHIDELIALESSITQTKQDQSYGKSALELTEKRLEIQINNLKQIT